MCTATRQMTDSEKKCEHTESTNFEWLQPSVLRQHQVFEFRQCPPVQSVCLCTVRLQPAQECGCDASIPACGTPVNDVPANVSFCRLLVKPVDQLDHGEGLRDISSICCVTRTLNTCSSMAWIDSACHKRLLMSAQHHQNCVGGSKRVFAMWVTASSGLMADRVRSRSGQCCIDCCAMMQQSRLPRVSKA